MADADYACRSVFYKICTQFYIKGECGKADDCKYAHVTKEQVTLKEKPSVNLEYVFGECTKTTADDIAGSFESKYEASGSSSSQPQQQAVCKFFGQGNCFNGENCKFLHPDPEPQPDSPVSDGRDESPSSSASASSVISTGTAFRIPSDDWVNAPEFVPKQSAPAPTRSYAQIVNLTGSGSDKHQTVEGEAEKLCPYAEADGICRFAIGECPYLHGDICDLCGCASLHPFDAEQRKAHNQECVKRHEQDMELSFAIARSKEKTCGICFEVIMEKSSREQRFGILPNCNHCFCLSCIRTWRQAHQFANKIIRACPECRVTSDFVCPSMYWVDTKEEKEKLIVDYKEALSRKDCKYFKRGRGKCPFGNKCFYLHALPDGTKKDVGPPPRQQRRQNADGGIDVLQQIILWDYLDDRDNRWLQAITEDIDDLVAFISDSEDSDWSEYDLFDC